MAKSTSKSLFQAREILDMAIQIEKQGVDFYKNCLAAELPVKVRKVFQYLLDQEHRHILTFEKMRNDLSDYPLPESYTGESESYIKSFAEEKVFTSPEKSPDAAGGIGDPIEAINVGLEFENQSIAFYQKMKKVVPKSNSNAIEEVIAQERDHRKQLESLRKEISRQ